MPTYFFAATGFILKFAFGAMKEEGSGFVTAVIAYQVLWLLPLTLLIDVVGFPMFLVYSICKSSEGAA